MSLTSHRYGKADVRVLKVIRRGERHTMLEMRVRVLLSLYTIDDFTSGDNHDIVATDTQKNTVYVLAKRHEFSTVEEFAQIICQHFISTYKQVKAVWADVEGTHWARQRVNGSEHAHAFVKLGDYLRFAKAHRVRTAQGSNTSTLQLSAGLKGLDILKTTQSGFESYHKDEYTTLKEVRDRLFRTVVELEYHFDGTRSDVATLPFDSVFNTTLQILFDEFSGDPVKGVYSPSVQNTQYLVQKRILEKIPQINAVDVVMPNRHCIVVDLKPFDLKNDNEVFVATDEPAGHITSTMTRSKL